MKLPGKIQKSEYLRFDSIENTGLFCAGFTGKGGFTYPGIADELGISEDRMVHPLETHTCNVRPVSSRNGGEGIVKPTTLTDVDGLTTDEPGLALALIMSDCAPVYLADPVRKCIGLCHSGREGTRQNIAAALLKTMADCYGTDPDDVIAVIGPCICRNCYTVDRNTAEIFASAFPAQSRFRILSEQDGIFRLDIAGAICLQLKEAGVGRVIMPKYCTCHSGRFFSYRGGDGEKSNCAWLMLK